MEKRELYSALFNDEFWNAKLQNTISVQKSSHIASFLFRKKVPRVKNKQAKVDILCEKKYISQFNSYGSTIQQFAEYKRNLTITW